MSNNIINPFLLTDGYKTGHHKMYPQGTTMVYSNFTPRHGKHSNIKGSKGVISFGQQMVMRQIKEIFDGGFFKKKKQSRMYHQNLRRGEPNGLALINAKNYCKDRVLLEIKKEYSMYLNTDYDVSHIEELWDLGYLPIKVKAIPEGLN